ncbi:MAG: adenylate/guanylate cyclase domain-containing protein [Thermoleophilia bacterium]|nr:adenylate/guanylate cyclase domain-containing protein [Thermoleophilia bacterium]
MTPLSAPELARRAGVSRERIEELVALGLIAPAGDAFVAADVERVRLVEALETSGTSLERLAEAVRDGRVPLGAIAGVSPREVEFSDRSIGAIAAELGISLDLVAYVYAMWGLSAPEPDEPLRSDDAALWDVFARIYRGTIEPDIFVACNRVFAEGVRKVVDGVSEHVRAGFEAQLAADGGTPADRLVALGDESRRIAPLIAAIAHWGLNRFLEHELVDYFVTLAEDAVADGAQQRVARGSAIAFVDLSGFTALAEQRGDAEAAEKAATLGRLVQETAQRFGGRLVKLLGDGAMLSFADAARAVDSGLDLVASAPSLDLPAAHVGIAAGPVVRKDGDVFGRTVNLASRIADYARPGEVLVDERVTRDAAGAGIRFEPVGPVRLKGIAGPVTVYAARPLVSA